MTDIVEENSAVNQKKHYSIADIYANAKKILREHHIENHALDARIIMMHVLEMSMTEFFRMQKEDISCENMLEIENMISRRAKSEPIAYITGYKEFYSITYIVDKNVLIPRPDSEAFIDLTLKLFPDKNVELNILELGVGTGCLVLTLLHYYKNMTALGVDKNPAAIRNTTKNIEKFKLEKNIEIIESDWSENKWRLGRENSFDLIISNPPYIANDAQLSHDITKYEPATALFAGDAGLDCYHEIAAISKSLLKSDGLIMVEVGHEQSSAVIDIFSSLNYKLSDIQHDMQGIPRVLAFNKCDVF